MCHSNIARASGRCDRSWVKHGISIAVGCLFAGLTLLGTGPAIGKPATEHAQLADPQGEPIVIGSIHRIKSSVYGDEQILTVRLPRGYSDNPTKRYPVVFSVDGGADQDFELLAGIAAEAEFSTSFEPFILVGIKTADRSKQLTPPMTRLAPERLKENFGDRMVAAGGAQVRPISEPRCDPLGDRPLSDRP